MRATVLSLWFSNVLACFVWFVTVSGCLFCPYTMAPCLLVDIGVNPLPGDPQKNLWNSVCGVVEVMWLVHNNWDSWRTQDKFVALARNGQAAVRPENATAM
jgi:hypothetical protein